MRLLAGLTVSLLTACASTRPVATPETHREAVSDTLHGTVVKDPYRWLEDEKAPAVQAWMKEQDTLARRELAKLPGRESVVARMKELTDVDVTEPPVIRAGRVFYVKRLKGGNRGIVFWRESLGGPERTLLDPNLWDGGTTSLGAWDVSRDGRKIAYVRHPNAADAGEMRVLDVDSGVESATEKLPGAGYGVPSWARDGSGFAYTRTPESKDIKDAERLARTELVFHPLGKPPSADVVLHEATGKPELYLSGSFTEDGKYRIASINKGAETRIYYQRVGSGDRGWTPFAERPDTEYSVSEWKDFFYVTTDEGASRSRVFRAATAHPERGAWTEIIPTDPEATLQGTVLAGGRILATYLRDAHSELRIFELDGKPVRVVTLPGLGEVGHLQAEPDSDDAFFSFESFVTPQTVLHLSMKTGALEVWARSAAPVDPARFTVRQVFYKSKDGTRVPMFLAAAKTTVLDGNAPTLLNGYGGFDISMLPSFSPALVSWMEHGGVFALANLRGGGEYGKAWHDAGKGAHKQNVFDDFIGAALALEGPEHVTRPERLAITGGSNGGLLMGAMFVQRPELFGAVVCSAPLLDMVRYHHFGIAPLWTPEYGSADNEAEFRTLYAYSPYHHVRDGVHYPPLLMLSPDHDDRVDPMHARKFVAAVEDANPGVTGKSPVYLRIERNSGHTGADRVDQQIEKDADRAVFLFRMLKMSTGAGTEAGSPPAR